MSFFVSFFALILPLLWESYFNKWSKKERLHCHLVTLQGGEWIHPSLTPSLGPHQSAPVLVQQFLQSSPKCWTHTDVLRVKSVTIGRIYAMHKILHIVVSFEMNTTYGLWTVIVCLSGSDTSCTSVAGWPNDECSHDGDWRLFSYWTLIIFCSPWYQFSGPCSTNCILWIV